MTNKNINHVLSDYLRVMVNQQLSRCKVASMIRANDTDDFDKLWQEHERIRNNFTRIYRENSNVIQHTTVNQQNNLNNSESTVEHKKCKPTFSYLDLKIKIAEKMFQQCNFCEKSCGIDRRYETGECEVDSPRISSEFIHVGEEPPLVPSHTVFFSGCNFNCVYCQNWDISQNPDRGIILSAENLALIIENRRKQGSRNVNFVGGDPTPQLLHILRTMKLVRNNIPVVWNSNMYLSTEAMHLLDGFIDLYLTDFKYGNNECALRLSGVPNYMEVVGRNHQMAFKAGKMIVRHLILPNHVECCSKPFIKWMSENLSQEVVLNIMSQYHPAYHAHKYEEISRLPLPGEIGEVIQYARDLGFNNLI